MAGRPGWVCRALAGRGVIASGSGQSPKRRRCQTSRSAGGSRPPRHLSECLSAQRRSRGDRASAGASPWPAAVSSGCRPLRVSWSAHCALASSGVSCSVWGALQSSLRVRAERQETSGVAWLLWSFASRASATRPMRRLEWHAGGRRRRQAHLCNGRASCTSTDGRTPALTWAGLASWCPST